MDISTRAKRIIMDPAAEWRVIATEATTTADLFRGYAAPLALIPAVCGFVGSILLLSVLGMGRGSFVGGLLQAIIGYVLGLAGIWVVGKIIEFLAPKFGGSASETDAMKLAIYSSTASWLAGVFLLIPFLGILTILGLYGLYIFYRGAPVVARVPESQTLVFTLAVIVVTIVISVLVGYLAALIAF
ncbi:YIP1 family protein [Roseomonas sp. NAR14]|uniref:YIP1 family protein n=1 Tax=Roseomonas acroporae TaxID=2937791 RepID=A0A9X2BXE7_9PROT|nr:Yip1 family protein [Roseomonas acroporae]MCK8785879.1 YIP1 family protein [Roseomonas acroporae]